MKDLKEEIIKLLPKELNAYIIALFADKLESLISERENEDAEKRYEEAIKYFQVNHPQLIFHIDQFPHTLKTIEIASGHKPNQE